MLLLESGVQSGGQEQRNHKVDHAAEGRDAERSRSAEDRVEAVCAHWRIGLRGLWPGAG